MEAVLGEDTVCMECGAAIVLAERVRPEYVCVDPERHEDGTLYLLPSGRDKGRLLELGGQIRNIMARRGGLYRRHCCGR